MASPGDPAPAGELFVVGSGHPLNPIEQATEGLARIHSGQILIGKPFQMSFPAILQLYVEDLFVQDAGCLETEFVRHHHPPLTRGLNRSRFLGHLDQVQEAWNPGASQGIASIRGRGRPRSSRIDVVRNRHGGVVQPVRPIRVGGWLGKGEVVVANWICSWFAGYPLPIAASSLARSRGIVELLRPLRPDRRGPSPAELHPKAKRSAAADTPDRAAFRPVVFSVLRRCTFSR